MIIPSIVCGVQYKLTLFSIFYCILFIISDRVRIWAEPSVVESAAFEFSETEDFLKIAEDLTWYVTALYDVIYVYSNIYFLSNNNFNSPYAWGRYDVLCLPPSFPYGGMENPCLTFATPTLLAGDKSLADVIAHEISHSWTGNLVTNATWEHFWLNEGWTVWLERKITSRFKGSTDHLMLSAEMGWKHLKGNLHKPRYTQ
jgi:leukotriene-A4 hydrolase